MEEVEDLESAAEEVLAADEARGGVDESGGDGVEESGGSGADGPRGSVDSVTGSGIDAAVTSPVGTTHQDENNRFSPSGDYIK